MEYSQSEAILKDFKSGKILPVYIFHGEEDFFTDRLVSFLENNLLSEAEKSFNQSILYGRECDFKQVLDEARQYPMMSDRRVVIVKEAQWMRDLDKLVGYFLHPAPQTVLVLAYKGKKIDGRAKWLKKIKSSDDVGIFISEKIKDYKLGAWLDNYMRLKKRSISPQANTLLCEYLGNDLRKLVNEIEKIELNIDASREIGVEEIEKYIGISKDFNVFELTSALGLRKEQKAFQVAQYLASNIKRNPMPMIMPALFQYFQKVYITQHSSLSDQNLARQLRINPFFVREFKAAAAMYSAEGLRNIFTAIKDADARSKGVGNRKIPPGEILMELVGKIFLN